jgi:hypothetical protein
MREMQCLQQSRFVAGIQYRHEAVEYRECCAYRSLIRLGLSLVDSDDRCSARWKCQPTTARKMRI